MYSFEGDFRRKPEQNLAGASAQNKTNRDALILQTQIQRQKREEHRKRLNSTIKIQAHVRSFLTRLKIKQCERENFDILFPKDDKFDLTLLAELTAKLLFFYDDEKDLNRMISLSQLLLKHHKQLYVNGGPIIQIRRLLVLHIKLLNRLDPMGQFSIAIPLRMLEVFTSVSSEIHTTVINVENVAQSFLFLVQRGYFREIRILLDTRTPPLMSSPGFPPSRSLPLCSALSDLVERPLSLVSRINSPQYDDVILTDFAETFLCKEYTDPVQYYILCTLTEGANQFPFLSFVYCLNDFKKFDNHSLRNSSWLLHAFLTLEGDNFVNELMLSSDARLPCNPQMLVYLRVLAKLTVNLCNKSISYEYKDALSSQHNVQEDSDSDTEPSPTCVRENAILSESIGMLNSKDRCLMVACTQIQEGEVNEGFLECLSEICHNLLLSDRLAVHKYKLLYTLAFKPEFLRRLWHWISSMTHVSTFGGSSMPLLSALATGIGAEASGVQVDRLLAPLAVFCALFSLLIGTLHDTEFCKDDGGMAQGSSSCTQAFTFSELGPLCRTLRQVCLGLVELAYPESRPAVKDSYRNLVPSHSTNGDPHSRKQTAVWTHLFKVCVHLLRQLHARSGRLRFLPEEEWCAEGGGAELPSALAALASAALRPPARLRPFRPVRALHLPNLLGNKEDGPPMTTKEIRTMMILKEIPFVVPFAMRVQVFQELLIKDKNETQTVLSNFLQGPVINLTVRRSHLYEDAFDKLRPENEPDLKLKMRVQLINQVGADEAGVDGGGVFREFLSELLKSAFDPNRGLFRLTKDNMLYPNPAVHLLYDDFPRHYYFVGRLLGKALYENLLVELPLAEFFLGKLCGSSAQDVHCLASLDPALYRGLLQLKAHHRRDVPDLGLDFTIVSDDLGEQRVEELKPGGANIPVTAENRIEYIHLVADYKLNKQIMAQCMALKRGVNSVISPLWLRMFSCRELQILVSGAEVPVDLVDLQQHTHYSGGYTPTHPTIRVFWKVVENFTDDQKRQLLKFVTSCSRPPLLGFKELDPPFCIQHAGTSDRLPSASTCMNLLKLPEFDSEQTLREKLLYAIQSGAGFELS